jgi:hypothetical protein
VGSPDCDPIATPSAGTPNTTATPCDPTADVGAAGKTGVSRRRRQPWARCCCLLPDLRLAGPLLSWLGSWPGRRECVRRWLANVAGAFPGRMLCLGMVELSRRRLGRRSSRPAHRCPASPASEVTGDPTREGRVPLPSISGLSALVIPFGGPVGRGLCGRLAPLRGSGAARPQGALRAIDPCGRRAFLADLRSAPPAAAISARPGCHAGWAVGRRSSEPGA